MQALSNSAPPSTAAVREARTIVWLRFIFESIPAVDGQLKGVETGAGPLR
jgi:hypothetical protein